MADCRITCITKPNVNSPHEHITHVGNPMWSPRRITVQNVINDIRGGINSFYVQDARGNRADVGIVAATATRREHIRTYADGYFNDNLLSLDQCGL